MKLVTLSPLQLHILTTSSVLQFHFTTDFTERKLSSGVPFPSGRDSLIFVSYMTSSVIFLVSCPHYLKFIGLFKAMDRLNGFFSHFSQVRSYFDRYQKLLHGWRRSDTFFKRPPIYHLQTSLSYTSGIIY